MTTLKIPVRPEDHIQGPANAPATLVEYGDYECPYCRAANPVVKRLQKHFGDRLRFVFRNFPLTQMHPQAEPATETAEFAGTHQKFWEMHDLLYKNQDSLGLPLYQELVATLKLPVKGLLLALESHEFIPRIQADFAGGVRSGVNGTPTFFINSQRFDLAHEYDLLRIAIEDAIAHPPPRAAKA
jgi:protein-disulfide isomerase